MNDLAQPHQSNGAPTPQPGMDGAYYDADDSSVYLERFWKEAVDLKYWILGILALGLLAGILISLLSTNLYSAKSRLEIVQVVSNAADIDPIGDDGRISDIQYLKTQNELLESRFMARRVAEAGNLARDDRFLEAFGLDQEVEVTAPKIEKALLNNVSIEPIELSSLVDVAFSSSSPSLSMDISNLWAREFIAANYEKRFGANIEAREFLENQIAELRDQLAVSERELVEYAGQNEILVLNSSSSDSTGSDTASQSLIASDLEALNRALAEAVAERISIESKARSGVKGPDQTGSTREKLVQAESEMARLKAVFGPDYPALKEKRAEVSVLRNELRRLQSSVNSNVGKELSAARMKEGQLRGELRKAKNNFLSQQNQGIRYGILKREVDTNRELYDGLLQRFKSLEASGAGQNNIKLIDEAELPSGPYAPSWELNLALSLILSIMASAALVFLRSALGQTLRDPQNVKAELGIPLLGAIPLNSAEDLTEALLVRSSEFSEAYSTTRTNLNFTTPNGAPKVLMLTSTVPSEGKSISSVALATSFAQLGKRTLLLDADLRASVLSGTLDTPVEVGGGLAALLSGQIKSLADCASHVERFGFDFVGAGPVPPNPVELLAGEGLHRVLEEARANYDQIIIDAPPILALADALQLAAAVDGVAYVIEYNRIKVKGIQDAIGRLRSSGADLKGAIVTKVEEGGVGYGYGYGYGYGHDKQKEATS